MVFSSQIFLFYFLPLALAGYYALPLRARNGFLTVASYVFYGWWSPWFVTLMAASTLVDWCCGLALAKAGAQPARRRLALTTSLCANLGLLAFFKYFVFAQETFDRVLEAFGATGLGTWQIVLPVGISFYTFQSMSYTIDLYRGRVQRARTLADFACYVSLFPQLIAGPIVRYSQLELQLRQRPQRGELFADGVLSFMLGFAKKVLIANPCGEIADLCFDAGSMSPDVAWYGIVAYAFQIYFDFSGYSDMAIGLGNMFGFRLPVNFDSPYRSRSITEFWRRWHISLSTWLRDYLYIPLGGNRGGARKTYRNLAITMLLGGLWHGAAWTFLAWGALHGSLLALERAFGKRPLYAALPGPLRTLLTFVLVLFAWILFRAPDLGAALEYMRALFVGRGEAPAAALLAARAYEPFHLFVFAVAAALTWWGRPTREWVERGSTEWRVALPACALFALAVVAMFGQSENPFLYFQF